MGSIQLTGLNDGYRLHLNDIDRLCEEQERSWRYCDNKLVLSTILGCIMWNKEIGGSNWFERDELIVSQLN
mgnify:CR=1 FL=1